MTSHVGPICFFFFITILLLTFPIDLDSKEGHAKNQREKSIRLCCSWGEQLEDGNLTYAIIGGADLKTYEAVVKAVEEWDSKLEDLDLEEVKDD